MPESLCISLHIVERGEFVFLKTVDLLKDIKADVSRSVAFVVKTTPGMTLYTQSSTAV